jgi:hypothetical protein
VRCGGHNLGRTHSDLIQMAQEVIIKAQHVTNENMGQILYENVDGPNLNSAKSKSPMEMQKGGVKRKT